MSEVIQCGAPSALAPLHGGRKVPFSFFSPYFHFFLLQNKSPPWMWWRYLCHCVHIWRNNLQSKPPQDGSGAEWNVTIVILESGKSRKITEINFRPNHGNLEKPCALSPGKSPSPLPLWAFPRCRFSVPFLSRPTPFLGPSVLLPRAEFQALCSPLLTRLEALVRRLLRFTPPRQPFQCPKPPHRRRRRKGGIDWRWHQK
jgi:hypothetical protein